MSKLGDFKNAIKATLHLDEQVRKPEDHQNKEEYNQLKEDLKQAKQAQADIKGDMMKDAMAPGAEAGPGDITAAEIQTKNEVKQSLQSRDAMTADDLKPGDLDFSDMKHAMEQVNDMNKSHTLDTAGVGDAQGASNASSVGQGQGGHSAGIGG